MQLKKTGYEYRTIYVTDSYQRLVDNIDNYEALTGLQTPFACENITDALSRAAAHNTTLAIEKAVPVTADASIPANITIDIREGGSFAVSTGITLTILGPLVTNGQLFGTVFTGLGSVVANSKGIFNEIHSGVGFLLGGADQDILVQSLTQKFPIGTRKVIDDRVFRYCKAGDDLTAINGGRCTNFPREGSTDAVEYAAGTYEITIPMNPNGVDYVAEQVAGYWNEGYIWIMQWPQLTGIGELYRIKSSAVAVGGFVTLTLHRPLTVTVPASTWITAWANPYQGIKTASNARMSVVAVPLIPVTSAYYFWGQTWGPIFMSSGQSPGRGDHERDVYFHPTAQSAGQQGVFPGSDISWDVAANPIPQRAGFLITNTSAWTNADGNPELGGDQFFMLQISP